MTLCMHKVMALSVHKVMTLSVHNPLTQNIVKCQHVVHTQCHILHLVFGDDLVVAQYFIVEHVRGPHLGGRGFNEVKPWKCGK